jgi:hypothetical protein
MINPCAYSIDDSSIDPVILKRSISNVDAAQRGDSSRQSSRGFAEQRPRT